MQIDIMSFTRRGIELSEKMRDEISSGQEECEVRLYTKYGKYQNLTVAEKNTFEKQEQKTAACRKPVYVKETIYDWMRARFGQNRNGKKTGVIWIGACGIAVRAMAPSLCDKLTDIPVLVVDEAGQFVIPVLSGHYGGANELAGWLAEQIGATPVITTATDVNHAFAVDVFAKENDLWIQNKEQIAAVSSKVLDGEKIVMLTDGKIKGKIPSSVIVLSEMTPEKQKNPVMPELPEVIISAGFPEKILPKHLRTKEFLQANTQAEPLWLIPRTIILGMGCKKGKNGKEIEQFVLETLEQEQISIRAVAALATIDLKKEEPGFLEFAKKYGLEFFTYPKETLKEVPGTFSSSAFVSQTVGVDNVCERAALAACQNKEVSGKPDCDCRKEQEKMLLQGRLLCKKKTKDGMTLAIAGREWSVRFDEA